MKKEGRTPYANELYGNPLRARATDHKGATLKGTKIAQRPVNIYRTHKGKRVVAVDVFLKKEYTKKQLKKRKKVVYKKDGLIIYLYRLTKTEHKAQHHVHWEIGDMVYADDRRGVNDFFRDYRSTFDRIIDEAIFISKKYPFFNPNMKMRWSMKIRLVDDRTGQSSEPKGYWYNRGLEMNRRSEGYIRRNSVKEWNINRREKMAIIDKNAYKRMYFHSLTLVLEVFTTPQDVAFCSTQRGVRDIYIER